MFNEKFEALRLLNNGIKKGESLNRAVIILTKYYKQEGKNKMEIRSKIIEWLKTYNLSIDFILNNKIDYVFENGGQFIDNISIPITLVDMRMIHEKFFNKTVRLVAFAILCNSKMNRDNNGMFKCNLKSISLWSGISRRHVMNIMKEIEDCGFLTVIERDKTKAIFEDRNTGGYKRVSNANIYKLDFDSGNELIYNITNDSNIVYEFAKIYRKCISEHGFNCTKMFLEFVNNYK